MGRRRTAKGHALPLPESIQPPDAFDLGIAGAAEDRSADLRPGHPDQDVRALLPGRTHGEDVGLGGRRARRLYAELTRGICTTAPQSSRGAAAAHLPMTLVRHTDWRSAVSRLPPGYIRRCRMPAPLNLARKMHHG